MSPETVDQLNLDSEDRVCDQLSGINHKGFFGALRQGEGDMERKEVELGNFAGLYES